MYEATHASITNVACYLSYIIHIAIASYVCAHLDLR